MLSNHHSLSWRRDAIRVYRGRWLVALTSACLLSVGATVVARVLADEDDDDPAVAEQPQIVISEQQFDQLVFGGGRQMAVKVNGVQRIEIVEKTASGFRKMLESELDTEIECLDRDCSLTESQRKKLRLAGRGDILGYFDRVADLRRRCTAKAMTQLEYTAIRREMTPLRIGQQQGELFGECSLFQKAQRHTLTSEQTGQIQALVRERQVMMVENVFFNWDGTPNGIKIPMPSRQKFIDMLVDYGDLPPTQTKYFQYIMLLEAGKQEDRLKPILSEETWGKLQTQITQAKRVEDSLRKSGQWPARPAEDDEVADVAKE